MATCALIDEIFVGTGLTGRRTGETFAPTGGIFVRTKGSCTGPCGMETIGKLGNFVEISGMINEMCALTGATYGMIVVTYGMTAVTFGTTPKGSGL